MLDEKQEYTYYTGNIDEILEGGDYRLRENTFLKNHFSGARRAMETIARKHLFPDGKESWPSPEDMQRAENILRHWCRSTLPARTKADYTSESALKPLEPELSSLDCWAQRYIRALCELKSKDAAKKIDDWHKRTQRFDVPLFDEEEQWRNDSNRITYQRVIADALLLGPLKTRYLVGDASRFGEVSNPGLKKQNSANQNYALAVMTAIMLQGDCGDGKKEGFVQVGPDRIRDWLRRDTDFRKDNILRLVWKTGNEVRPIFTVIPYGDEDSLWHVDDEWVEAGGWKLVDAFETETLRKANEDGFTIYGDTGHDIVIPGECIIPVVCIKPKLQKRRARRR